MKSNIILSLAAILCVICSNTYSEDPLPFKLPKLESVSVSAKKSEIISNEPGSEIQYFAKYGFSQDLKLEKWEDPLEERIKALEEKVADLVDAMKTSTKAEATEKKVEYRTERVLKYRQVCDGNGNCYDQPYYEEVQVPVDSTGSTVYSSPVVCPDCGRSDCVNAVMGSLTSSSLATYSTPNTVKVSSGRTLRGSPRFTLNSNGTVYRVARVRTFFRRLFGMR